MVAAGLALGAHALSVPLLSPILRRALNVGSFGADYVSALLPIAGEEALYLDLFRAARSV